MRAESTGTSPAGYPTVSFTANDEEIAILQLLIRSALETAPRMLPRPMKTEAALNRLRSMSKSLATLPTSTP